MKTKKGKRKKIKIPGIEIPSINLLKETKKKIENYYVNFKKDREKQKIRELKEQKLEQKKELVNQKKLEQKKRLDLLR